MAIIFISGSRTCKLDDACKRMIDDWIAKGHSFLVGDCKGVDFDVQNYLADQGCKRVTVCYSTVNGNASMLRCIDPRAASLGWETKGVESNEKPYTRSFYTSKDADMTHMATASVVIWDGKSAGSKANIDRAKACGHTVVVRLNGSWYKSKPSAR